MTADYININMTYLSANLAAKLMVVIRCRFHILLFSEGQKIAPDQKIRGE